MYEFGRIHYDQLECTKRNKVEAESRRDGSISVGHLLQKADGQLQK